MAFVLVSTRPLNAIEKRRLGDRILYALQAEGIKPGDTVIQYEREEGTTYVDGVIHEVEHETHQEHQHTTTVPSDDWKTRSRRTKAQLDELKLKVRELIRRDKTVSSFHLQDKLGLKDADWAPNTLRRITKELIESKEVTVTGQKRGTKYHWAVDESIPDVKLEKA